MMRVVLIRHENNPLDDRIVTYLRGLGVEPEVKRPYLGDELGPVDDRVVASVIYGGGFSVFEENQHPFLVDEARWIERCMKRGVPLLGICQGAQAIARALGAHVGPKPGNLCEFGYYELVPTLEGRDIFPDGLVVAQSHYHEFVLPSGATHLARSALFDVQAFRYGSVTYGFQFHPEVTPAGFRRWQDAPWARYGWPGAQTREEQDRLLQAHDADQHRWFISFLSQFLGPAVSRRMSGQSAGR